jgi:hypothetical protein
LTAYPKGSMHVPIPGTNCWRSACASCRTRSGVMIPIDAARGGAARDSGVQA